MNIPYHEPTNILGRSDTLLGKYLEINEATAVAKQWRSKHASTTTELLFETGIFFLCGAY
jgi:hypothetical protein